MYWTAYLYNMPKFGFEVKESSERNPETMTSTVYSFIDANEGIGGYKAVRESKRDAVSAMKDFIQDAIDREMNEVRSLEDLKNKMESAIKKEDYNG